jgi:hypothetical protein
VRASAAASRQALMKSRPDHGMIGHEQVCVNPLGQRPTVGCGLVPGQEAVLCDELVSEALQRLRKRAREIEVVNQSFCAWTDYTS